MDKIKELNLPENSVIKIDIFIERKVCYLCGQKIVTPLMVFTTNKSNRFSHLSCKLKQIESELFSFNKRIPIINQIKQRVLEYPNEILEEVKILNKHKILKALE